MCSKESPLSPSQVRFLSEKAFQSNIFQYCNEEFKRGIRLTQQIQCNCRYAVYHAYICGNCMLTLTRGKNSVCVSYRIFLDQTVERLESFWQQHGIPDPFKEYVLCSIIHACLDTQIYSY